jgi:hypothetical protein
MADAVAMGQRANAARSTHMTSFNDVHIEDPWEEDMAHLYTENGRICTGMIRISKIDQLPPKVLEIDPQSPAPMTTPLWKYDADSVKVPEAYNAVLDVPPPTFPPHTVVLTFGLLSDKSAYAIFSGNTKPFLCVREPAFDLEELEACTQELQKILLGDGSLKSSPTIERMKNTRQCDTTALLALVESLKECANVRFDV